MRFNFLARRIAAPALGLALAATVAACSSSSSSPAGSPSSASRASSAASSAPPSSAAPSSPGTGSTAEAAAQIKANWEKFFNSSTPISEKVKLLQNGAALEPAIRAFASLPLASGLESKVTHVTVDSATKATVTFDVTSSGGTTLLSGKQGTSVYQDGIWKVGTGSLCGLLRLIPGGTVPSACNSAG